MTIANTFLSVELCLDVALSKFEKDLYSGLPNMRVQLAETLVWERKNLVKEAITTTLFKDLSGRRTANRGSADLFGHPPIS